MLKVVSMPVKIKTKFHDRVRRKPKIKWGNIKKKKSEKKKQKYKKRVCEKCRRRFDHDRLVVHHKKNIKVKKIPKYKTEGMSVMKFNKLYLDKRKRPVYDKRKNMMVICKECYDELTE